ncbi:MULTISPECIES: hypothetical protein [unclassified Streptomyces]|uniref:hypothetical protein n=1 Tax=unclassified Streptomyces TaxID=2593676 RepID=UPI000DDAC37B|nr:MULTISPECIES: hypothetical protein [unclassified Streptomyces]QZZ28944.1 hypothetical protein A7X85_24200 [Streptomyces sp. ST1015]
MNDPGPPPSYQGAGLVPPAGPARTWGLAVVGVPLVLVLLLTLVVSLSGGDDSGGSGGDWSGSSGWPGTSETTEATEGTETAEESATPSAPAYEESATPSPSPSLSPSDATGPEAVVTAYFAAINDRDFATAWSLGGKNLDRDYDTFVEGFATTESDSITITSVRGDDVALTLEARQTDGTTKTFDSVYTVSGGEIVRAKGTQTS